MPLYHATQRNERTMRAAFATWEKCVRSGLIMLITDSAILWSSFGTLCCFMELKRPHTRFSTDAYHREAQSSGDVPLGIRARWYANPTRERNHRMITITKVWLRHLEAVGANSILLMSPGLRTNASVVGLVSKEDFAPYASICLNREFAPGGNSITIKCNLTKISREERWWPPPC